MSEFPVTFDRAIKNIAKNKKIALGNNTHYAAINRELQWFEGNLLKRLDYNLDESSIKVTFLINRFSGNPKLMLFLYNLLPTTLKYPAKIEWESLKELPINGTEEFYYNEILNCINYASRNNGPLGGNGTE